MKNLNPPPPIIPTHRTQKHPSVREKTPPFTSHTPYPIKNQIQTRNPSIEEDPYSFFLSESLSFPTGTGSKLSTGGKGGGLRIGEPGVVRTVPRRERGEWKDSLGGPACPPERMGSAIFIVGSCFLGNENGAREKREKGGGVLIGKKSDSLS